jgi:hypothetical protein
MTKKMHILSAVIAGLLLAALVFVNDSFAYLRSEREGQAQRLSAGVMSLTVSAALNSGYKYMPGHDLVANGGLTSSLSYSVTEDCHIRLTLEYARETDGGFIRVTPGGTVISCVPYLTSEKGFITDAAGALDYVYDRDTADPQTTVANSGTITPLFSSITLSGESFELDSGTVTIRITAYVKQKDAPWVSVDALEFGI